MPHEIGKHVGPGAAKGPPEPKKEPRPGAAEKSRPASPVPVADPWSLTRAGLKVGDLMSGAEFKARYENQLPEDPWADCPHCAARRAAEAEKKRRQRKGPGK